MPTLINTKLLNWKSDKKEKKMNKEKKLIDNLKWLAKYSIEYIGKIKTEEPFDYGYKAAMKNILKEIEKYEKETNNDK